MVSKFNFSVLVAGILILNGCFASNWKYTGNSGPQFWEENSPKCGENKQSPINIETKSVLPDKQLSQLQFTGYNQNLTGGMLINNGHSAQLNFPAGKSFQLLSSVNSEIYLALQLHFHWTSKNVSTLGGSEHSVDGEFYDAEMHIVHIKQPYGSLDEIKSQPDGLAVIGVLIRATDQQNNDIQKLLDVAQLCEYAGDTHILEDGPELINLLPSSVSYYRYHGSLTTPPCYETVQWTVYKEPIYISHQQLRILQQLSASKNPDSINSENHDGENSHDTSASSHDTVDSRESNDVKLSDNFRPIQQLNGRIVSAYYDIDVAKSNSTHGWRYKNEGPRSWLAEYSTCNGNKQSPINLISTISESDEVHGLEFSSSYNKPASGFLENNGHTVMFEIDEHLELTFNENDRLFQVEQLHFHWGAATSDGDTKLKVTGGSEHTVDQKHFPIEMHIVHTNISPDDPDTDEEDRMLEDQFGVLGVFFEIAEDGITETADTTLGMITDMLHKVKYKDNSVRMDTGPILLDLLPQNKTYYRYMGSLTTPPCTEAVQWTVFYHSIPVSKERLLEFQNLFKVEENEITPLSNTKQLSQTNTQDLYISGNYRPVQTYDGRIVLLHVDHTVVVETGPDILQLVLWTIAGIAVFAALLSIIVCCKNKQKKPKDQYSAKYQIGKQDEDVISV
nr:carbonic anhydrase-like [Ciona intestinalis]|eukprot:XP_002120107.3 carbonic anhydrase-like [Ciona intestinalis]